MGLRYRIPFKDSDNKAYEVLVYRDGYTGEVKELTGAPSCFVVSGTDEDFMYVPVRTSTATISVLDSDLLLDLYSINNQYARVQLYREGVLEWTGYIKPEQFTQPYVPTVDVVSVEPIVGSNPLLTAKNCIITPHMSWAATEARARIVDITAANIRAYLAGTPQNVVNP